MKTYIGQSWYKFQIFLYTPPLHSSFALPATPWPLAGGSETSGIKCANLCKKMFEMRIFYISRKIIFIDTAYS